MLSWRLLVVAAFATLFLIGCRTNNQRPPRIVVLGVDGVDPDVVDLLISEGKLPNIAQLRREGAYGRLQSMQPMLSPILWTTIATGRAPLDHGIGHFVATNERTKSEVPVTSSMRRVKALWNVLSEHNLTTGVVGWWATWPAEDVKGVIVSDHTAYHFLSEDGFSRSNSTDAIGLISPADLLARIAPLVRGPSDVRFDELSSFATVERESFAAPHAFTDDLAQLKWIVSSMDTYAAIGSYLWTSLSPDLLLVYLEGTDSASHLFGHLFRARPLSSELGEQQRKFGHTVERIYEYADEIVGRYLRLMASDDVLVVLSDHGFSLGNPLDDPSQASNVRRVTASAHRDQGILCLYGRGIATGATVTAASILDIAPTILAILGVPASREMPGRVLKEALPDMEERPRVASYEDGERTDLQGRPDDHSSVDSVILERLRTLGYLDVTSPSGDRNVAAMKFTEGRLADAAQDYERIIATNPNDASSRVGLAGAYGALGRYDDALRLLDEAQQLAPLLPEIYHNRGAIFEREGDPMRAAEQYATALRYSPSYEASRSALERLTGSASVDLPENDTQLRAFAIAQQAQEQARRGETEAAWESIQAALALAPRYVVLRQYEANIAYLRGDHQAATRALEEALELEPGNALFRQNLENLRARRDGANGSPHPSTPPAPR